MRRRDIVTGIGLVGMSMLAGCATTGTDETTEPIDQPQTESPEETTETNETGTDEVKMEASVGVTFEETPDSVLIQLVSIQAADHVYIEGPDEENVVGGVLDGRESDYDAGLGGQFLYTEDEYGQEVGGVGSMVEYQKGAEAGRVYVIGVLDGVESIVTSYEFMPKGEEP